MDRSSSLLALVAAVGTAAFGAAALGGATPSAVAATNCPNATLRTGLSARLPGCRAYERVSPADSTVNRPAGVGVTFTPMVAKARADGERVMFTSAVSVGEAQRSGYNTMSISSRTAAGWKTFGTLTTAGDVDLDLGGQAPIAPYPSADLSHVAFRTGRGLGGPNPGSNNGGSAYLSAPPGSSAAPTWLSQPTIPGPIPASGSGNALIIGGSPSLSTTYFTFNGVLTDLFGDASRTQTGLYMYRDGAVTPAGRLPSGGVDPGGAMAAGVGAVGVSDGQGLTASGMHNSVSQDGSRLFFVTPYGTDTTTVRQLYVQQDGQPGRLISKDQDGHPAATGVTYLRGEASDNQVGRGYAFATADGSAVIFRSTSALAPGAPADSAVKTYRAKITDDAVTVEYLGHVDGAPMAIDADASRILFVEPVSNGVGNLELWDEHRPGGAPYSLVPDMRWNSSDYSGLINVRMTPDGSTVLFDSSAEIIPGVAMPGNVGSISGTSQVYRWSIGDARPTCVSCRTDGLAFGRFGAKSSNVVGMSTDNVSDPGGKFMDGFNQGTLSHQQGISDDGRRVFFDTIDPLDPIHDINDQRDVYMWEDGKVSLLTSGVGKAPSFLIDSSASGDDVFFTTMDGLVPGDANEDYDVYDARVDGGFAKPAPACSGDGCQGQVSAPPSQPSVGSVSFVGSGNVAALPGVVRPAVAAAQRRPVRAAVARLKVRVSGAGRIVVAGRRVRRVRRSVSKAGTYRVRVVLRPRARRVLRRHARLKTAVRVTYRTRDGRTAVRRVSVVFKRRAGARHGKGAAVRHAAASSSKRHARTSGKGR